MPRRTRESRALIIVRFFIANPVPHKDAFKVHSSGRSWRLAKRVFDGNNRYNDADLSAWESVIKSIQHEQRKEVNAKG